MLWAGGHPAAVQGSGGVGGQRRRTWARHLLQLLFQLTPLYLEEPFSAAGWLSCEDFLRGLPLLRVLPPSAECE